MCIRDSSLGGRGPGSRNRPSGPLHGSARCLWRPPLQSGAPLFRRFRAPQMAVWPVWRAGTVTTRG
eukprot:8622843-Alexandrium_andersonii.AAC.1